MVDPVSDKPTTGPTPPPPRRRRRWPWVIGTVVVLLGAIVAGGYGVLRSESGTAWLLSKVPGVQVSGVRGALFGAPLSAQQLNWSGPAGALEVRGLRVANIGVRPIGASGAWVALRIGTLHADRVQWRSAPSSAPGAPPTLPATLRLPVEASATVTVGALHIDDLAPVQDLKLTLHAGADHGREHRIDDLSLRWQQLRAEGSLRLATDAPFALTSDLRAAAIDGAPMPWSATVKTSGPLERLDVDAAVQGATAPDRAPASATLKATVTPLARWPLGALSASTEALDLAALADGLPQTRLNARAELRSVALDQPMQASVQIDNAEPGRWDEQRLPLHRAEVDITATANALERVSFDKLALVFGDAQGAAGRVDGSGAWVGHELTLDTRIDALVPQRLDARAPAMTVSGPLTARLRNLPAPDPAAAPPTGTPAIALQATLDGRLQAAPQPVHLALIADASAERIEVEQLQARSGSAKLSAKASARHQGQAWSVDSQGQLNEFDPRPWWPQPGNRAWQRGPHRLNGDWTVALTVPEPTGTQGAAELLQRLAGSIQLKIDRSVLAGVPLKVTVDASQQAATRVQARLELGENTLKLNGQADARGRGDTDRWQLNLDAPRLAALAPLAALHPAAAAWAPRQGKASAAVQATGRWPTMRTEGTLDIDQLRSNQLTVGRARATWQATTSTDAPLQLNVDASGIAWQEQRVPIARANVAGTLREHTLRAEATLPLQPPPAIAQPLALKTQSGTRIDIAGAGSWVKGKAGSRWSGTFQRIAAGPWNGRPLPANAAPPTGWLDARDLRAEVDFDAAGQLQRARADAGRAQLGGDIGLRWDDVVYDARPAQPELRLKAQVDTFAVAPFFARAQPSLGWSGDLRVGASVDVRAARTLDADIVIEREGGDLRVRDGGGAPLALGLSDLRLALNVHDGLWQFTQALAGTVVGEMGGLLRVQARPQDRWPQADAAVDGSVLLRVADLSIWGAWIPPGWRLGGSLATSAAFGGSFGAPQVTGELRGTDIALRNLLEGVNVTDGQVRVRLQGEQATIDTFTLRGGDGTLTVSGDATLGAKPSARIDLKADQFQVLGRIDRRVIMSGQAAMQFLADALQVDGKFVIDRALFDASRAGAPSLDEDVVVLRPGEEPPPIVDANENAPARDVRVAIDLDLGEQLNVRARGLDTRLAGQLRISAPRGRLAVNGSVRTVAGTYLAYGQDMKIERGVITFDGPPANPRLDVLALRQKTDIDVGVLATGTAQNPRIRLYSNPEMSESDKLSWLVLGRAPDQLGRADTALLQRAAVALLSGEGPGTTDKLIRNLGLDELSVSQSDGEVKDTVVTLGKQLSDRWYIGYERGVNATAGTWQLIYRIAQRFTLRAQSGDDTALDLIFSWRVK